MIDGFEKTQRTYEDVSRDVYVRGEGPGICVMHEVPGITPEVAGFSRRLSDEGFKVFMPDLFGNVNEPLGVGNTVKQISRACVSREFHVLATRRSSPITTWLRALCRDIDEEQRAAGTVARGVGALGMCLTGNFALALMVDPWVMAPVLSQPSLPFGVTPIHNAALHVSDDDLVTIKKRVKEENVKVLGMRFTTDALCPGARFKRLRKELGDGFEGIEIKSGPGSDPKIKFIAHSVVTNDLVDEEGHPTRVALERVFSFFRESLLPA